MMKGGAGGVRGGEWPEIFRPRTDKDWADCESSVNAPLKVFSKQQQQRVNNQQQQLQQQQLKQQLHQQQLQQQLLNINNNKLKHFCGQHKWKAQTKQTLNKSLSLSLPLV